jgi:phage baseplate assembly protein V
MPNPLANLVTRAVVSVLKPYVANALQGMQLTLLDDEIQDDVEHLQEFGFASAPLPGAEGVTLANRGQSGQRVVIGVDDRRFKPFRVAGESVHYNAFGCRIYQKADGSINIVAPAGVVITTTGATGTVTINGNLVATGNVSDANGSMQEMRTVFNGHGHPGTAGPPDSQMT